jgi:hypothetical protein
MEEKIFKILRENKIGHAKAHYIKNELLNLFSVSGSREKDAIMHYDLLIKRDLPNTFKPLRDHGNHCDFCNKINDIRTEAILNYR